jgi:hypothetical protein
MQQQDLHEVLGLLYNRFDSFQVLWSIYTTVAIGLIAAMISFPKHVSSTLARIIVIIGFSIFAYANHGALDLVNTERHYLQKEAKVIAKELRMTYGQERNIYTLVQKKKVLARKELFLFHLIMDGLVILLIWFVPKALVALRPFKSISDTRIQIKGSKLPDPKISWNQLSKIWILEEQVNVDINSKQLAKAVGVEIPKGFKFDLSTIPRFLWGFIAPFELSIIAPLVHDFLYVNKGKLTINDQNLLCVAEEGDEGIIVHISRLETDSIFLEHMKMEGIGFAKRWMAYLGVRLIGGIFWKDK